MLDLDKILNRPYSEEVVRDVVRNLKDVREKKPKKRTAEEIRQIKEEIALAALAKHRRIEDARPPKAGKLGRAVRKEVEEREMRIEEVTFNSTIEELLSEVS